MATTKSDWIDPSDNAFRAQCQLYKDVVGPVPANYDLNAADLSQFGSGLTGFINAEEEHNEKLEAARAARQTKDAARAALENLFRAQVRVIQASPTVSNAARAAAGLPVRDDSRSPIPAPVSAPLVILEKSDRLSHTLRLIDSANPTRRGKAVGVTGYNLYYKIGGDAPADITQCAFAGTVTRERFVKTFPGGDGNKTVWYIALAVNAKGQTGPMSETTEATIAA